MMKTVSVNYYLYILKILEDMGLDRNEIADSNPFELEVNCHPNARIEMDALRCLFGHAEKVLEDPHIGLHVSKNFRISNYGYAGRIFALSENIEQAMLLTRKYGSLAHTMGTFNKSSQKCKSGEIVKFNWSPSFDRVEDQAHRHITECVISNYALTINWLSWNFAQGVLEVRFRHRPSQHIEEYREILNCDVVFEASENSILIDTKSYTTPLPTANPIKLLSLQNTLNRHLAAYNLKSDISERVKHSLYYLIKHKRPDLKSVAIDLSLTERTLKRHLKNNGTRFQTLLNQVKQELCAGYLKEQISLSEIAQRLWYSDQSAFTRAYKKWHGSSPKQSKKQYGKN